METVKILIEPILLVLDLDETLLHASVSGLGYESDFTDTFYYYYKRPHVDEFLRRASKSFRMAIWSSASTSYVLQAAEKILPPIEWEFLWGRERNTLAYCAEEHARYHIKDFKKLRKKGINIERALMIDDTPSKCERNYGNAIYIPAYEGGEDDVLPILADYLETLKDVPNVRKVEKRGWLRNMQNAQRLNHEESR